LIGQRDRQKGHADPIHRKMEPAPGDCKILHLSFRTASGVKPAPPSD
jgi:hypothetical protein